MRFDELDLEDEILDGLDDMNFQEMTPVQEHTIPVILEGRDIIGCAQTGTGKTAAYTLPLLNRLLIEGNEDNVIKSVIIVPTRELAQQIDQQFQGFSYYLPVSTTVVYGGGDGKGWDVQKRGMLMGSDVVIATPGRMISHIQNSGIDLSHVECLILDEADRMLDMGFSEDIMKIVSYMPKDRQTIMFSATLPPKIREMARTILRNPAEVNIAISKPNEAMEQAQREEVMLDFKNNKVSILVATDIVARGIDIEDIGLVINYDVPHDPEDYIHRIGRTARAAATGSAVTFVSEDEQGKFHAIEKFIERDIRKAELPASVGAGPVYNPAVNNGRGRGGRGGGRGRGGSNGGSRGRGRADKGERAGRERRNDRERGAAAAENPGIAVPQAAPADNDHASGRGEGNRGTRDRKHRHRGGRNRRRGDKPQGGETPQPGGSVPRE